MQFPAFALSQAQQPNTVNHCSHYKSQGKSHDSSMPLRLHDRAVQNCQTTVLSLSLFVLSNTNGNSFYSLHPVLLSFESHLLHLSIYAPLLYLKRSVNTLYTLHSGMTIGDYNFLISDTAAQIHFFLEVAWNISLPEGGHWGPKWVYFLHAPRVWAPQPARFKLSSDM